MGSDTEFDIAKTFGHFENDEFLKAKEDLTYFFRKKTNDHLKSELGLKEDPIPVDEE